MTDWPVIWLGVIAIAVALMALIQIVVLIAVTRLALQAINGVKELRREIGPLIQKVNQIADDARTVSSKAVEQIERVESMVGATAARIDDTLGALHRIVTGPVRQGSAFAAAFRAFFSAFGRKSDRGRPARDDEDALFVG